MSTVKLGIILILLGFAFMLTGALLSARESSFGGLIMIGPIPIAFGSSPIITLIAIAAAILLMLLFWRGNA